MSIAPPSVTLTGQRLALLAGASLVAGLVSGCSGAQGIRSASAALPQAPVGAVQAKADKAVARAEAAVAKAPQDAAARAALGTAYLAAGRFASAATALDDAMSLGDNSGRTALALALAKTGAGRPREAVALLDEWRAEIPASDLGLALALAGETSRGVAILADAVRAGENSPKLRQNLAYAYALDGRWGDAKLMAAQDVPADQLDKRLAFWALSMLPDRNVDRVASLIGAPVRLLDPGQPAALALQVAPGQPREQFATQASAPEAPAVAAVEPSGELAPLAVAAAPSVVSANLAVQQQAAAPARFAPAAAPVAARAPAPAKVRRSVAEAFAAQPDLPTPFVKAAPARRARAVHVATMVKPVVAGSHFVQLGAFASEAGARRAWGIYTRHDPSLAAFRMTITPATVKGKAVWRVAAGGLGGRMAANTLCAQVKAGGGACFAYAGPALAPARAVPGVPAAQGAGPQRARR